MQIVVREGDVREGDERKTIDTSTEQGRQEMAVLLDRLMCQDGVVFLVKGKNIYRVTVERWY